MNKKVYVTKPFLPPKKEFLKYIDYIYDTNILTNQGPLVLKLEHELRKFLDVEYLHYVVNGTLAIQIALKSLNVEGGEVITTPFSYIATISSILWERCIPVFVDIEKENFTIDTSKIESAITKNTRAILAVHVFGYACNIIEIDKIAKKYNLKVIYDAAHTFGSKYDGKSLSSYGDISTLSFHATKVFHTIEGGACVVKDKDISKKIELMIRFGHNQDDHIMLGINAKQDEFNAAMGLSNLKYFCEIKKKRKEMSFIYDSYLKNIYRPKKQLNLDYNYSYYPVVFEDEKTLLHVFAELKKHNIFPRRYFYPSLNTIAYINSKNKCPISEDISKRIACLPLYDSLGESDVLKVINIINNI